MPPGLRCSLLLTALLLAPSEGWAQADGCEGPRPDSLAIALPPIYRECEVTRKAERRGSEPRLGVGIPWPRAGDSPCMLAEFRFVVDSSGQVEPATIHVGTSNHPVFAAEVRKSLPRLRYRPAQLEGRPVRQLVLYQRSEAFPRSFRVQRMAPGRVLPDQGQEPPWPLTPC